MLFRLYITRLKCVFKNKENILWNYLLPIGLVTCYYFAFGNIWSASDFETIKIAYVQTSQEENELDPLNEALSMAEMTDGVPMFDIEYCNRENASELLDKDDITAYIVSDEEPELYVKQNGINETILKSFLDSYNRVALTIKGILIEQPNALNEGLLDDVMQYKSYVSEKEASVKPDPLLIYYYALLAYVCIFAANRGLEEVTNIQANRSNRGARINVSPISKMKLLLINMLAALTAHFGSLILMLFYMNKVLNISFGNNTPRLILACFIGSLVGIFMGTTVGVWVNKSNGVQQAILTTTVLVGSFLSGMMLADMKYLIVKNLPILSYINPVNLVSDSLYSLYYYDTFDRFYMNIIILLVMAVVMGTASYIGLRRKTYESI